MYAGMQHVLQQAVKVNTHILNKHTNIRRKQMKFWAETHTYAHRMRKLVQVNYFASWSQRIV